MLNSTHPEAVAADRLRMLRWCTFACFALTALASPVTWGDFHHRATLDLSRVAPAGGHMHVIELPQLEALADRDDEPHRSRLLLTEGGRALGPGHAIRAEIATLGAGRFAHHGRFLYFSASDNSEIGPNGRAYAISYPARLNIAVASILGTASLALVVVFARSLGGVPYTQVRLAHLAAAFRKAGGDALLEIMLILITVRLLVLIASAPDDAAEALDLFRRSIQRAVSIAAGIVGTTCSTSSRDTRFRPRVRPGFPCCLCCSLSAHACHATRSSFSYTCLSSHSSSMLSSDSPGFACRGGLGRWEGSGLMRRGLSRGSGCGG
jgi:hypothetical protein